MEEGASEKLYNLNGESSSLQGQLQTSTATRGHSKGLCTTVFNTTALYTYKWLDGSFYVMCIFKMTIKTFLNVLSKNKQSKHVVLLRFELPRWR